MKKSYELDYEQFVFLQESNMRCKVSVVLKTNFFVSQSQDNLIDQALA